jgi:hypothetical protein
VGFDIHRHTGLQRGVYDGAKRRSTIQDIGDFAIYPSICLYIPRAGNVNENQLQIIQEFDSNHITIVKFVYFMLVGILISLLIKSPWLNDNKMWQLLVVALL